MDKYLSILIRMIFIVHFQKKLQLLTCQLKIELNLELNRKKILKTSKPQKACNLINIYQMKLWNNLCQRKELALDQKKDHFMNKNQV